METQTPRPKSLTTRDDLHHNLTLSLKRPTVLSVKARDALSPSERAAYAAERRAYLSGRLIINTPQIQTVLDLLDMFDEEESEDIGTQSLIALHGPGGNGKTTGVKAGMRHVLDRYESAHPGFRTTHRTPIFYVTMPSTISPRDLWVRLARYYGTSIGNTEKMSSIQDRMINIMNATDLQLGVFDEAHRISSGNRVNGDAVNVIREIMNEVPANFILAGVDLMNTALFSGRQGQQLSARSYEVELRTYERALPNDRADWMSTLRVFEKALPLADLKPGDLTSHAELLFDKTTGSLGTLSKLLRGISTQVIRGSAPIETITEAQIAIRPVDVKATRIRDSQVLKRARKKAA